MSSVKHTLRAPRGAVQAHVIRADEPPAKRILRAYLRDAFPAKGLPEWLNNWREENNFNFRRGFDTVAAALMNGIPTFYGALYAKVITPVGFMDYGLVSLRIVTSVGVNAIVDAFQNLVELENFKFHGIGTGNAAEAASDTQLGAELTTQYNPDNTRATGTLTEGASANIFRTVGTNPVDAAVSITEHGIFNQAATGGGTLLDRSVFTAVALANGDSLQTTYDLTLSAGG